MKKTMRALTIIAVLVIAMFALTGCGNTKKEKEKAVDPIVGVWTYENGGYTYTFNEDGTGNYAYYSTKMEFTYKTEGNKLEITYSGSTSPFKTEFTIEGNTLNIKDSFGKDTIYKKK